MADSLAEALTRINQAELDQAYDLVETDWPLRAAEDVRYFAMASFWDRAWWSWLNRCATNDGYLLQEFYGFLGWSGDPEGYLRWLNRTALASETEGAAC